MTRTTVISDLEIGGETMECTKAEFDKLIYGNIHSQCELEGVGTFYFVLQGDKPWRGMNHHRVSLKFFDEDEGMMHTSIVELWAKKGVTKSVALARNLFIFNGKLMIINDSWTRVKYLRLDEECHTRITDLSQYQTSVHKTGLSRIRESASSDFTLKSEDGETIEVHKAVLEGLWPFFRGMLDSNMTEVSEGFVKFPMPKTTLEVIVRYLYGEQLELEFEDAANLIVFAQMYDLPELLKMATFEVKKNILDLGQAVLLWKKGLEAENENIRDFATDIIRDLISETDDFPAKTSHLEKDEQICLLQDLVLQAKPTKRVKIKVEDEEEYYYVVN